MKDSDFCQVHPEVWGRIQNYSVSLARGRGITVHIELEYSDWLIVRQEMLNEVQRLAAMPYEQRGMEGSVVLRSLQIAIGRVDEVVK